MNEKYSLEDEAIMIQALSMRDLERVWQEYVESCETPEDRIYWRNLFFDCLTNFDRSLKESLPAPMRFRLEIEEWVKTI